MSALFRSKLLFLVLWAGLIAAGFGAAWKYETVSGRASTLAYRPEGAGASRRLTMFVHPECPCTHASLLGIRSLIAEGLDPSSVEIVVVGDKASVASLRRSKNAMEAQTIPGVQVTYDPDGSIADKFGASTSGQVFLFGEDGAVLFRGGITDLRGHEGPSVGLESLRQALHGQTPEVRETRVLGCEFSSKEVRKCRTER